MACALKIIILLAAFLFLSGRKQHVGAVVWVHGRINDLKVIKEIVNLLDEVRMIPNGDPTRINDTLKLINTISSKVDTLSSQVPRNSSMDKCETYIADLTSRYNKMGMMSRNIGGYANLTKESFAKWNVITPSTGSVETLLVHMFSSCLAYVGERYSRTPLLDRISCKFQRMNNLQEYSTLSAQQYFYIDYLEFTILGLKAYLINKFSWIILGNISGENFSAEEEIFCSEHEERSAFTAEKLRKRIMESEMELRACDPEIWKENVNYAQLTRLIQGFIVNEVNLNPLQTCSDNCEYHVNRKISDCYWADPFCHRDKSAGKILTCQSDTNNDIITVCPSTDPSRRYEYIHSNRYWGSHKIYGTRRSCAKKELTATSWLRGLFRCSYCFCLIDEKSEKSDRFFNLRAVLSDIENNKVVTGVRFVKKNRVIHLQIQQGELAPFGLIKENSTQWKSLEEYDLTIGKDRIDYVTLHSKYRSIDLDDIIAEKSSYIVTGVKINEGKNRLYLSVRITEFDFESGKLIHAEISSQWIASLQWHRNPIPLKTGNEGPKVSTHAKEISVPSPPKYNYVEFTASSKKEDASQTTLPFIDTQKVVSLTPTPLSGVGLFHKGHKGYGGFIAPKIFTLNLLPRI